MEGRERSGKYKKKYKNMHSVAQKNNKIIKLFREKGEKGENIDIT